MKTKYTLNQSIEILNKRIETYEQALSLDKNLIEHFYKIYTISRIFSIECEWKTKELEKVHRKNAIYSYINKDENLRTLLNNFYDVNINILDLYCRTKWILSQVQKWYNNTWIDIENSYICSVFDNLFLIIQYKNDDDVFAYNLDVELFKNIQRHFSEIERNIKDEENFIVRILNTNEINLNNVITEQELEQMCDIIGFNQCNYQNMGVVFEIMRNSNFDLYQKYQNCKEISDIHFDIDTEICYKQADKIINEFKTKGIKMCCFQYDKDYYISIDKRTIFDYMYKIGE